MKGIPRYLFAIALGTVIFAALQYLFPLPSAAKTAKLECAFATAEGAVPAQVPYSASKLSKVNFEAELTGKSIHDGVVLWHADGLANFQGGPQNLAGSVFVTRSNEVLGLGLYRDRYPHQKVDLRVSTLNENGKLDWNSEIAFVYFENAPDKLAHRYAYRCNVTKDESA